MSQLQAQDFVRELDKKTNKVLLRGKITFQDLQNETNFSWLDKGAEKYQAAQIAVDELSKMAGEYQFIVFAGTWCEDTRDLLPKFYKVLVDAGIDFRAVTIFAVNRDKEALNIERTLYSITRVPTFIVMHQFREVGRITESVSTSIEQDLLDIIRKDYASMQEEKARRLR
jgi:thiol-disulfide isomerase/thioredoxin